MTGSVLVKVDVAEARLAYVAVTAARHRLEIGGLGWINQHPDGNLGGNISAPGSGR